jgi:hypothetical protein
VNDASTNRRPRLTERSCRGSQVRIRALAAENQAGSENLRGEKVQSEAEKTERTGALREGQIQKREPGRRKSWRQLPARATRSSRTKRNRARGTRCTATLPRAERKSDEATGAETRSKEKPAADGSHARKTDRRPAAAVDEKQAAETKTGKEQ